MGQDCCFDPLRSFGSFYLSKTPQVQYMFIFESVNYHGHLPVPNLTSLLLKSSKQLFPGHSQRQS